LGVSVENMKNTSLVPPERIENTIFFIRGQKVMLDEDLAELYGVETKNLNKAVKRNIDRFPEDFMFQLNKKEWENLRFQIGTSSLEYGGRRYAPYVFTEQGVAMLSSVLQSKKAIAVNVEIMRAFVRLRRILASNKALSEKIIKLEEKYDAQFKAVFDAIRELMIPPEIERPSIGFKLDD
jgi:phage regulator Rha-like protein